MAEKVESVENVEKTSEEQKTKSKPKRSKVWKYWLIVAIILAASYYIIQLSMPDLFAEGAHLTESQLTAKYFLGTFLPQVVNFSLVAVLLGYFGEPMLKKMIRDRKDNLEKEIKEAAALKQDALAKKEQIDQKIANYDVEAKEIMANYDEMISKEHDRIISDARKQAERISNDAEMLAAATAVDETRKFERDVMEQSLARAEATLKQRMETDAALRNRLIDQSIAAIQINA